MFVYWFLMTIHVIVSICLLIVVLLQSGKGGGLAGAFGGGGGAAQTMFGGRGAGDVLTRTTQVLGGTFMVTSLALFLLGGSIQGGDISGDTQRRIEELRREALQDAPAPVTLPPATGLPGGGGLGDTPIQLPATPPDGGTAPAGDAPSSDTPSGDGGTSSSDEGGS